ncbi:PspC domain-containing protein [Gordonia hankookensis]|uniref:PspC domain-containing protein n=2 Tax=Gordonia hankookensis TaxID=589403 RepID=A0ABR7WDZ2_9ACTN|nr:PspC domain-containing protein [Gordonia hankookensis]
MDFMDTKQFEGMWATRPIRPNHDRTVAGVCAGIGARYRVDPTLVKIAFVVATLFGGSGLVLYIAAWVALPAESRSRDELGSIRHAASAAGRRPRHLRHRNPPFILLIVLAIIVLTSFGPSRTWSSGGLLGAALMLVGWWLLYQRTPEPPAGTSVDTAQPEQIEAAASTDRLQPWIPRALTADASAGHPAGTYPDLPTAQAMSAGTTTSSGRPPWSGTTEAAPTDFQQRTPPAWDPLGTAQFAWDLPDPTPDRAPIEPADRRSPLTLIVVGVAVITAAAGAALHQAGVDWFTPARILSLALAVVGAGLIYAGFRRRTTGRHSSGLVPIALGLGVAVVATSLVGHLDGLPSGGVGERIYTPVTESDIKGEYSLTMGRMVLDLRDLDLTADRTVTLRNGVGEIEVQVPKDMNVRATCDSGVGDYTCPDGLSGGDDGTDGPVLNLNARTNIGHVEVAR